MYTIRHRRTLYPMLSRDRVYKAKTLMEARPLLAEVRAYQPHIYDPEDIRIYATKEDGDTVVSTKLVPEATCKW